MPGSYSERSRRRIASTGHSGVVMARFRFRSLLDNGWFVLLVMAASLAAALLEIGATNARPWF